MICFPNAKINLGLHVLSRRQDGYHEIETVYYPIDMKDALEIVPSDSGEKYRLFQSGIIIQGNVRDNLVVKALHLISQHHQIPDLDIHLLKKIPFEAGLGGGSANAACMLQLLNKTFSLNYSDSQLMTFATQLGADCAFFIKNKPALATGIGEVLEDIELNLNLYKMVVVRPNISVSTKDAYAMISPHLSRVSLASVVKTPINEWKETLVNDFELPIFRKYPEIKNIKQKLYDLGAIYASMSGSGSAVYALFENEPLLPVFPNDYFVWTNYDMTTSPLE